MAELVALFKKRKRWEQALFIFVVALELLALYNVLVGLWLFATHQFPLMNVRGLALILGMLCLRLALMMYIARWHRAAFWIMIGLTVLAQLTGVVDLQDVLSAALYGWLVFPFAKHQPTAHA